MVWACIMEIDLMGSLFEVEDGRCKCTSLVSNLIMPSTYKESCDIQTQSHIHYFRSVGLDYAIQNNDEETSNLRMVGMHYKSTKLIQAKMKNIRLLLSTL